MGAIDGIIGLGLGAYEDARQVKQQGRLNDGNKKYNQEMTIFNREQQMKMWEDTNYKAQREQMEKAIH